MSTRFDLFPAHISTTRGKFTRAAGSLLFLLILLDGRPLYEKWFSLGPRLSDPLSWIVVLSCLLLAADIFSTLSFNRPLLFSYRSIAVDESGIVLSRSLFRKERLVWSDINAIKIERTTILFQTLSHAAEIGIESLLYEERNRLLGLLATRSAGLGISFKDPVSVPA